MNIKRTIKKILGMPRNIKLNSMIYVRGNAVSHLLAERISSDKPIMVARFGSNEITALENVAKMINGKKSWNFRDEFKYFHTVAGFFPIQKDSLTDYYHLCMNDILELDVLGSWCVNELSFENKMKNALRVPLEDLEPYYHELPWTSALEGKRVLVVHPFADSIIRQYDNSRDKLFGSLRVLPDFDLITYKSVQALDKGHNFSSWFDALDKMKSDVSQIDFDVAIIGCGAFGFNLAAHVKRMGKQAVHLGGATQILFGIKGQRWESIPKVAQLFNEYWVRPSQSEVPSEYKNVEGGCYW